MNVCARQRTAVDAEAGGNGNFRKSGTDAIGGRCHRVQA
jgi:hypothetical protein